MGHFELDLSRICPYFLKQILWVTQHNCCQISALQWSLAEGTAGFCSNAVYIQTETKTDATLHIISLWKDLMASLFCQKACSLPNSPDSSGDWLLGNQAIPSREFSLSLQQMPSHSDTKGFKASVLLCITQKVKIICGAFKTSKTSHELYWKCSAGDIVSSTLHNWIAQDNRKKGWKKKEEKKGWKTVKCSWS